MTDNILTADMENEATEVSTAPQKDPNRVIIFEEALEAILFAAGHPVSYATLARVFEMTPEDVKAKVYDYAYKYNDTEMPRGVMLLTFSETCQLCTKQYYLTEIRDALGIKKSGTLSTSSMEALAIVAYNQPVTRVFVDTLRRVDSSYAMNNLLDRGLIESKGRLDAPGRPMLYGTTGDFLRCFGLESLSALPKTSEELMQMFSNAKISDGDDENGAVQETIDLDIALDAAKKEEAELLSDDAETITISTETEEPETEDPSADDNVITDF